MSLIKLPTSGEAVTMCNQMGRTPLHLAAQLNDVETAIELLQIGAAIDGKDIVSHTLYTHSMYSACVQLYIVYCMGGGGLVERVHNVQYIIICRPQTPSTFTL